MNLLYLRDNNGLPTVSVAAEVEKTETDTEYRATIKYAIARWNSKMDKFHKHVGRNCASGRLAAGQVAGTLQVTWAVDGVGMTTSGLMHALVQNLTKYRESRKVRKGAKKWLRDAEAKRQKKLKEKQDQKYTT